MSHGHARSHAALVAVGAWWAVDGVGGCCAVCADHGRGEGLLVGACDQKRSCNWSGGTLRVCHGEEASGAEESKESNHVGGCLVVWFW